MDKVLVRTKPGGGAKAAYTSPAISFAVFSACGGATDMLNVRKPRPVWATIFGELEKGGDLVKPLVDVAAIATPAKAVRFAAAGGRLGPDSPHFEIWTS